ncbi:MAG: GNAT family N-acetyltransferase [Euryarchaeota archaeon]|nr:GNAT family N-acetyltransferase [Euryarchaeota archaeon]
MRMRKPVFLDGRRIFLRPIDMRDMERFFRWFNDPRLRRHLLLPFPTTRMAEKEFIERMTKLKDGVVLSIVVKRGGRLIGNVSLFKINGIHRSADLGIAIADLSMASKGFGTEAMGLVLDYAFGTLNLNRVELSVHDFNRRAEAAYRRLGFVEEGRRRQSYYCDGEYHDDILMAMLRDEWKNGRG